MPEPRTSDEVVSLFPEPKALSAVDVSTLPTEEAEALRQKTAQMLELQKEIKDRTATFKELKDEVAVAMGDNEALTDGEKLLVTFKKDADSIDDVTNWEALAGDLAVMLGPEHKEEVLKAIAARTEKGKVIRKGGRKFVLKDPNKASSKKSGKAKTQRIAA